MSKASRRTGSGARDRGDRLQPWIAAFLTALLHLLLLVLVMLAPPITMTAPQGGEAGSSLQVTYIDASLTPPPPVRPPATRTPAPRKPRKAAPTVPHVQTTLVTEADEAAQEAAADAVDSAATPPDTEATPPPEEPTPTRPVVPETPAERPAQAWGQPPGMRLEDLAPVNAGPARSRATGGGRRHADSSSGTGLEVDGYQVYYGLVDETRLRAWRDQGMTELFIPLPGTRRLMVCPLEVALRRESGACRMVEPDAPELEAIGDARDVITMQRIYKLGDVLWRGPGAYR
jgi:hypothetical protein